MGPKIVDKDEKRRQIAFAAMDVFGEKGFERTRMEDVAVEAGVGKGTIYEYFRDKEALLQGAFNMLMEGFLEEMQPEIDPEVSPFETLRKMAMATVEMMVELGHVYMFFLEYMLHTSRVEGDYRGLSEMLTGFRQFVTQLLDEGIRRGEVRPEVDTEKAAAMFAAWFDGAIFHWIVLPDTVSLEDMAAEYLEIMFHGLKTSIEKDKGGDR